MSNNKEMFDAIGRREAAAVADRLQEAFGWADSVHGQDYWEQVCNRLRDIAAGRDNGPPPEAPQPGTNGGW